MLSTVYAIARLCCWVVVLDLYLCDCASLPCAAEHYNAGAPILRLTLIYGVHLHLLLQIVI